MSTPYANGKKTIAYVLNQHTGQLEVAEEVKCPRCSIFGGLRFLAAEGCTVCNSKGYVMQSDSGWLRAKFSKVHMSMLFTKEKMK
jgi:DnaJ-class molecular chaperone